MSEKKELSIKNPDQAYETAVKALIPAVPILEKMGSGFRGIDDANRG